MTTKNKTHKLLVFGDGETYEGLNDKQYIVEVTSEGLRKMEDEETKPFYLDLVHDIVSIHSVKTGEKLDYDDLP